MMKAELAETIRKRLATMGVREKLSPTSPFAAHVREMEIDDLIRLTQHAVGSPDEQFIEAYKAAGFQWKR